MIKTDDDPKAPLLFPLVCYGFESAVPPKENRQGLRSAEISRECLSHECRRIDSQRVGRVDVIVKRIGRGLLLGVALALSGCDANTPLMDRVIDEDKQAVEKLIAEGADVDERNNYGWTALMHAGRIGSLEFTELLLDHGADVNAQDETGRTALLKASFAGHTDVVSELLARGANVNLTDEMGRSALHWSVTRGRQEVVKLLLAHGADYTLKTTDGWTARMLAMKEGETEILALLTQAGAKE